MTEFHDLRTVAMNHADLRDRLKAQYGLADDDQALIDTLDGLSDLKDMVIWAARRVKELEAQSAGLKDYIGSLKMRQERIDGSAAALRECIAIAMLESGETSIKDAAVTLSARIGPSKVHVVNELELPAEYMRQKITSAPDKDAIREALDAGHAVPGAQLTNGQPTLTLRVK